MGCQPRFRRNHSLAPLPCLLSQCSLLVILLLMMDDTGRTSSIGSAAVDGVRAGGDHSETEASAAYALSSPSAAMGSGDSVTQSAPDTVTMIANSDRGDSGSSADIGASDTGNGSSGTSVNAALSSPSTTSGVLSCRNHNRTSTCAVEFPVDDQISGRVPANVWNSRRTSEIETIDTSTTSSPSAAGDDDASMTQSGDCVDVMMCDEQDTPQPAPAAQPERPHPGPSSLQQPPPAGQPSVPTHGPSSLHQPPRAGQPHVPTHGPSSLHQPPQRAFRTFEPAHFRFGNSIPEVPLQEWLIALPLADHKPQKRFKAQHLSHMITEVNGLVAGLQGESKEEALARVSADIRKTYTTLWQQLPAVLKRDIYNAPAHGIPAVHLFALLVYSYELYEDFDSKSPKESCPFQLYKEANRVCRQCGHCKSIEGELKKEWVLFQPFLMHVDAAVRVLPPVESIVFRGMSRGSETHHYPMGSQGSWGGFLSASSDRLQGATFVSKEDQLQADDGSFFMILSDQARPMYHLSRFPEEMEHLQPLDLVLEACNVLPSSICQMLSLRISFITFKRAGAPLSFDLWVKGLRALGFIYDPFLQSYVPPWVKEDPYARTAFKIEDKVKEFVESPEGVLLIAARSGMGKTACALWLARDVMWSDRIWIFVSLPSVKDLFSHNALVRHVAAMLGFQESDDALVALKKKRMVWILDSLDEVRAPEHEVGQSWLELNSLGEWEVKLIVSCRQEHTKSYGKCLGPQPPTLYLQGFREEQVEEYVQRRVRAQRSPRPPDVVSRRRHWQHSALPTVASVMALCMPSGMTAAAIATAALASSACVSVAATVQACERRRVQEMKSSIFESPIRNSFSTPFKLMMGLDLLMAEALENVGRECDLYEGWLNHKLGTRGLSSLEEKRELWSHAECLAWELHLRSSTHEKVGDRGQEAWFRRLPLRIHDYGSTGTFSYQHKSLQEFLVASRLYRALTEAHAADLLSEMDLTRDYPVLRFFGDICAAKARGGGSRNVQQVYYRLWDNVRSSKGSPERGACAASSISLLNAARVSLSGRDLSGVHIPKANLQGGQMFKTKFCGANLRGANLKGAVLEQSDFRGADLSSVIASELLQTLQGHTGRVYTVALSTDGQTVISGSWDKTVRIWNAASGELLQTLQGHTDAVRSVALSTDGQTVISGSWDKTVRIWNAASGELLQTLQGHTDAVRSVALSTDGQTVISGSEDRTVRIWNAASGELLQTLQGHTRRVESVALSTDGQTVISGSEDETVRIWNASSGELLQTLQGHTDAVYSVALSTDGQTVISGSWDKTVRIWNAASGELLQTLQGHTDAVRSVALSTDGQTVISGSEDRTLRIWNAASGELLQTLQGHTDAVWSVALSTDGQTVISGSEDETMRIWNAASGELLQTLQGHTDAVYSVALSTDGQTVISGSEDETVRIWNAASGELLQTLQGHTGRVYTVALSTDGQTVISGSWDKTVRIWNAASGELLQTLQGHTDAVRSVALSTDGHTVISGSWDRTLRIWNAASGELLQTLQGHTDAVRSVALSTDGQTVISGSSDKTVRIWNAASGELLQTLRGHTGRVGTVALSTDGQTVISGSEDETVRIWNAASGELLQTLQGHTDAVYSVALSTDGQTVISGSSDETVRIWNAASGELLHTLQGHTDAVWSMALSTDGQTVISGSEDKTVRIWNMALSLDCQSTVFGAKRHATSIWSKPPHSCRVLRECSERQLQLFCKGLQLSNKTQISMSLKGFLKENGAVDLEQNTEDREEEQ